MRAWLVWKVLAVTLDKLEEACEAISSVAHRWTVEPPTAKRGISRVTVEYSNPDEYGFPRPIRATFIAVYHDSLENWVVFLNSLGCTRVSGPGVKTTYEPYLAVMEPLEAYFEKHYAWSLKQ